MKAILSGKFGLINPETEVDAISPDGWTSYRTGIKNSTDKTGSTQLTKEARWSDAEKTVADVQIKAYYTLNRQMDFIFVADCSNSMSGIGSNDAMNSNFYNMQSKMMDVTEKLLSDTSELDTRVAFATFGEEESSVSDFFVKGDEAKAETYIWNDIVNYYSNTNYSVGLEKASELVKQNRAAGRNTTVIFISDGQPYYDGKVENIPPEYYGTEQAEAIRADGAKLFAVLQQVPEDELESSQANMLKLTADEGNIFSSTDLDGFSHAINDAIEYAYTNFQLTDVVDPAFELDETSINVTGGTVTLGTNAAGLTTITWTFHQSTEPFKEYILTFQEKLNPNSDGSYPDGSFDTNEGDAVFEADKVPVNQVKTPVLERENEKKTGDLIVKKTVSGNNANRNYAFTFRIEAEEAGTPLSGSFGDVTFTDGEGSFTLKAGEQAAVTGLPEGTSYKVQETDGVRMGYTVTVNGTKTDTAEGSVVSGETAIETFNNHRTSGGSSGGGGGGGVVPGKPYHPETKDPLIPEGETAESSSSPHPEINSLPIMGVAGPAEEIQDASDSGAQPLENKSLSVIEALQAKYTQNPDLGGWLTVPGTGSGYPVMYSAYSWEYYLHHDFNKQSSNVGVPFMGEATEIGGDNTLIHGHNMNGDLQFGWIWNYLYPEFREKHPTIDFKTIYDADGQYEVMAVFIAPVYAAEDTNVFKWYQYVGKLNKAQFNYYVENAKANSLYDTGVTAEYGDKLITLETCASSTTNDRLVVVARKKAL
ncbi:MAG: sortase [Eubacteriales bacterium]|nr:sortase [Eubacteriales bacterium]